MAQQPGQAAQQPEPSVLDRLTAFAQNEAEPEQEEAEQEAPEPEQASEETAPEEGEGEAEQVEEASVEIDPDTPLIEITVKGETGDDETRLWSLNEMKRGVMMQKDYQRKTAEVARARDTIDTEVQQQVTEARNNYVQGLQLAEQTLLALVVPELNNVDMEKLAAENPAQAVQLQARAQRLNNAVNGIRQQIAQANQQAMQKAAEQSKRILTDPINGIPGWGADMYSSIINDGSKAYGFAPEEVANVVDHRMIRVLHDALQYNKAKHAKPAPKPAPKVMKPGAPRGRDERQEAEVTKLRQRVKQTGDVKDAAALYLRLHPNG